MASDSDSKRNQINAIVAEMCQAYIADMPEIFDELAGLIHRLSDKTLAASQFAELYRKVHSLKGTSGTYKLNGIFQTSLDFETYLSHVLPTIEDGDVNMNTVQDRATEFLEQLQSQLRQLVSNG